MGNGNFSEVSSVGEKCIALFKVARDEGISLPSPNVHMYLAHILEIPNNAELQRGMQGYVVSSLDELNDIVEMDKCSLSPNARPYLFGKMTGDFVTSFNSLAGSEIDIGLPSACYSIAGYYGDKMGKGEEALVFGLLAMDLEKYTGLLEKYHLRVRADSEFEVSDKDFLGFREYFEASKRVDIVVPRKRDRKDSEFLL